MNITSPTEMSSGVSKFEQALTKFERLLNGQEKDCTYYHVVTDEEYNRQTCDAIEKAYSEAGWAKVICRTSSENGERGGLTGLHLWLEFSETI